MYAQTQVLGALPPLPLPNVTLYESSCPICWFIPDINECASNNGGCSDGCNNTKGSYYCTCSSGYELSGDNVTCIGESKLTYLALKIVHSGMYMYKNNGTYLL